MMAISFKGAHFPQDIILMGVRWYVASPLSYRHVEEFMDERGVSVDHATIQRWVVKYGPLLEEAFHRRKRPVWVSWRMDETYMKVKGQWCYRYRAVDRHGQTIDFLLTEHRDKEAALRFPQIFHDEGLSGAQVQRPGLDAALAALTPGDVLVVWRLDRLGRSMPHLVSLVHTLGLQGVGFQSLTEAINTTTAGGKLVFHIMGALAEFERALIAERSHAGMQAARRRGGAANILAGSAS